MLDKLSVTFLIRLRILYAPASSMAVRVGVWGGGGMKYGGGRGNEICQCFFYSRFN